jgi:hypothetical protein
MRTIEDEMLAIKSAERGLRRSSGSPHVRSRVPTLGRMRVRGGDWRATEPDSPLPLLALKRAAWRFPVVRASNEGSSRPRVARAREIDRLLLLSFLIPLLLPGMEGVAKVALDCAHRTSTVSSCAFCEQGGHLAAPCPTLASESPPPVQYKLRCNPLAFWQFLVIRVAQRMSLNAD